MPSMFMKHLLPVLIAPIIAYSQRTTAPIVLCVPGQCLQGYSNVTIGAQFTAPGFDIPLHLLPGQYTDRTSPQYLHDVLTSPSVANTPALGFSNATRLPLDIQPQPGLLIYSEPRYSGRAGFSSLPDIPIVNASLPLTAESIAISNNLVASVTSGSSNSRIVFWDSVPDISQLPIRASGSLSLNNLFSIACSPPCSASGICSSGGTCACLPGFTGSSCEECQPGFFGPKCDACPLDCDECDEGIAGTGRCLQLRIPGKPDQCNCVNGACAADGQCQCTAGFVTGPDGVACASCANGFFRSSTGDCKVCGAGCSECEDTTGVCTSCRPGFTQDGSDRSICAPPSQVRSDGAICPERTFANGGDCAICDPACGSCTGPTANDCTTCTSRTVFQGNVCITPTLEGVCPNSQLIADNVKKRCDSCGAKCTTCIIPGFSAASTIDARQCTGCIPGFFLSGGECVETCPDGTFVGPDLRTCQACDQSCRTCGSSATNCLTCPNNLLVSSGQCVTTCPSSSFPTGSPATSCTTCHADCASCFGSSFNQCTACPPDRPVLLNGRCLPTCTKTQFFNAASGACQACDSTCASCVGPGSADCLSCLSPSNVLRQGSCVAGQCQGSTSVVPGLGVCLSDLVVVQSTTGAPLPGVSGINTPTARKLKLEWWQILLMVLGCCFILLVIVWLLRRRVKKKRESKTAQAKRRMFFLGNRGGWDTTERSFGWRVKHFFAKGMRALGKAFARRRSDNGRGIGVDATGMAEAPTVGGKKITLIPYAEGEIKYEFPLKDIQAAEEARGARVISPPIMKETDLHDLMGSPRRAPLPPPLAFRCSTQSMFPSSSPAGYLANDNSSPVSGRDPERPPRPVSLMSAESIYSQMTASRLTRAPSSRSRVSMKRRELAGMMDMFPMPGEAPRQTGPP